ncbi:Glu-tRNA(Gln) amidotransferase subunit GatD [Desulfurococcaceae archaeon MEX13E-LK6-19]|nr:Glu-tRNA(Gln) amidotransferase subunit GatD [Desulfurococcaceae archaeon MEX13E-LK6-19]
MSEELFGYTGVVKELLEKAGARIGDRIRVIRGDRVFEGILMPRERLYGEKPILVIKLDNGYNVGIRVNEKTVIEIISKKKSIAPVTETRVKLRENLPKVIMVSTGGTIVSKVDYETGAVKPALSTAELLEWIPEIGDIAYIDMVEVARIFSEDMTPSMWGFIAEKVYKYMIDGYDGVVIAHGTDTMGYTAAALAFAIRNKRTPIVLVGSQRSSDRPSTDSAFNLKAAFLTAARAPFAESVVVMHGETGDTYALAHRGTKVRKMHTSRRDAFQSINDKPLAIIYPDKMEIKIINKIIEYRGKDKEPILMNKFDDKVVLLKTYPGMEPEIIDFFVDKKYHGIVLEGTGLGHTPQRLIDSIKRAVEEGIPVVMTSQCLFGRINMHVYSTGRKLLAAGVIPGSDMLPETAYVKLSWILGQTRDLNEVRRLMLTNIAGEINDRHTVDLYPRWPL